MRSNRIYPLRFLLPAGVLSQFYMVTTRSHAHNGESNKADDDSFAEEAADESIGARLAKRLEAWLLPAARVDILGPTLKSLRDAVAEDTKMSPEETKRLPLNALMLKAMHDRERLEETAVSKAGDGRSADLDARDRETVLKADHFLRFAGASYGMLGYLGRMKALVTEETAKGVPPPDLVTSTDYLQKWFVAKHTGVDVDDVKEVVTTGSVETRAYFVAVDHSTRSVVLSIRGTFSLADTVADLVCNPVGFAGGIAHQGISHSARSVWATVKDVVEGMLREYDGYQLVLTGHSLGAGTAILLKIMFACDPAVLEAESRMSDSHKKAPPARLDAGRAVHVECYAFAPPPVFSADGTADLVDMFSFVNESDCVPTISFGSLHGLFRTLRNVDRLPLDVYQRAGFILDSRVRVQQSERGVEAEAGHDDRHTIASKILDLSEKATTPFFRRRITAANGDSQKEKKNATLSGGEENPDQSPPGAMGGTEEKGACDYGVWTTISSIEGDITRFTRDVSEAASKLFNAVEHVGEAAEQVYDGVGSVTDDVLNMSSDEAALTALLVQRLAVGGGPSPDEVMSMVRKCQEDGRQSRQESLRLGLTVEDLVIPGKIFLLEGGAVGDGSSVNCLVRRIKSRARGIRLSNRMVDDHFMDAYELAMEAAARRYSRD